MRSQVINVRIKLTGDKVRAYCSGASRTAGYINIKEVADYVINGEAKISFSEVHYLERARVARYVSKINETIQLRGKKQRINYGEN